jgi:hypothetical protein
VRRALLVAAVGSALVAGCAGESGDSPEAGTITARETVTKPEPDPPVSVPGNERPNVARLSCSERRTANIDYFTDVGGFPDPVTAARQSLGKRLRSGDEVENVGSSTRPVVTVARNGKTVAIVRFMKADNGWLADQIEACATFGPG